MNNPNFELPSCRTAAEGTQAGNPPGPAYAHETGNPVGTLAERIVESGEVNPGTRPEPGRFNPDLMFSSKTDLWATPQDFFAKLDSEFGFTLDVCALPENAKCPRYYTPQDDGLTQPWVGTCWCNPPYGRSVGLWVQRAAQACAEGNTVVMLLPARTDTRWFHDYIYQHENVEIRFIRGRLKFGDGQNSAPFPSLVAVFRPKKDDNIIIKEDTNHE